MNFEHWLISIGKSGRTAKSYSRAVFGVISGWAIEAGIITKNFQEIESVGEFRLAREKVCLLPIFEARNTVGKGMYRAALNLFEHYLAEVFQTDVEEDIQEILDCGELVNTEKKSLISARLGQGAYRKSLIKVWGGCAVTGYADTRLLVASHMKPWARSTSVERLDPFNGLLLLPTLDKVFDLGFVSFEESGRICISRELEDTAGLGIHDQMKVNLKPENLEYLEFHRNMTFQR